MKTLRATKRFESGSDRECNGYEVYKVFRYFVHEDMKNTYDESTPDELIVLDFIAGMTDSYVLRSFEELFIPKPTV